MRVTAAAELFHLTGDAAYRSFFDAHYADQASTDNGHQPIISGYFETGASFDIQRGMVTYALTSGATASVVTAIKASLEEGIRRQPYGQRDNDPYKCFMWDGHYTWGSNGMKAQWAMLALWGQKLAVNPAMSAAYQNLAEEYQHYYQRSKSSWVDLPHSSTVIRCGQTCHQRISRVVSSRKPMGEKSCPWNIAGRPQPILPTRCVLQGCD